MFPNQIRTLLRKLADQREFITSNLDRFKGKEKEVQARLRQIDSQTAQLEADLALQEKTKSLASPLVSEAVTSKKPDKYPPPQFAPGSVSELSWKLDELLAKKYLTTAERAEAQRLAKEIFEKRGKTLIQEPPPALGAWTEPAGTKKAVEALYPREDVLKDVYKRPYSKTTLQIDFLKQRVSYLEEKRTAVSARMWELRSYELQTPELAAKRAELIKKTQKELSALDDAIAAKKDELYNAAVRDYQQSHTLSQYYEKVYAEAYASPIERTPLLKPGEFDKLSLQEKMKKLDEIQKQGVQLRYTGEFEIKKGVFAPSYYTKIVEPAEYERYLVRDILSKPERKQAYLDKLTLEEQQWIQKRGGIDRIIEREKARMLNEIFFEEGSKKSEKGILYLREQWEKQVARRDLSYVNYLFGSMNEAQKIAETTGGHRKVLFFEYEPIQKMLAQPEAISKSIIPKHRAQFEQDKSIIDWATLQANPRTATVTYRTTRGEQRSLGYIPAKEAEWFENVPYTPRDPGAKTTYQSRQVSIEGEVIEILPAAGKKEQYVLISDETGTIRVSTFIDDPVQKLEPGKKYRFENVFLQPYAMGKSVYYGINVKPSAGSRIVQSTSLPEVTSTRKPLMTFYQRPTDPVVSTTVEGGRVIAITRSGKRMSSEEYLRYAKQDIIEQKKKTGLQLTEKEIKDIEDLNEYELFMAGLFPLGLLGPGLKPEQPTPLTPFEPQLPLTPEEKQAALRVAHQRNLDQVKAMLAVPAELGGIWYEKAREIYPGYKERDIEYRRQMAEGTMPLYRKYLPIDFGLTMLDVLGGALHPLTYPMQALWGEYAGVGAMEGIRQEIRPAEVLGIEQPLAALGADILGDPLSWTVAGAVKKPALVKGIKDIPGNVRAMLADTSAAVGRKEKTYIEEVAKSHGRTPEVQQILMKGEALAMPDGTITPLTEQARAILKKTATDDWFRYRHKFQVSGTAKAPVAQPLKPTAPQVPATAPAPVIQPAPVDDWFKYRYQFQRPRTQTPQMPPTQRPSVVSDIATKLLLAGMGTTATAIAAGYLAGEMSPEIPEQTAMGVVPSQTLYERSLAQPSFFREDEGALWKALHLLSIDTYAMGGMIETAKSALDSERDFRFYGYQHRIPVSQALGVADPEELSWRTIPALAVDIATSPLTYATFGTGAAARITLMTGKTVALNPKGLKVLKRLTQAKDAAGEARFLDDLATSPAAQKEYLAFEGIGLRGWGPFFGGREMELVSPQRLQALKGIATRAMPETAISAKMALRMAEAAAKAKEAVSRRIVPFYDVKKLPRPATLKPDEMEFADAFLHYQKSTQWEAGKYLRRAKELSRKAKEAFGPEYRTQVRDYIEAPVTRESAGLTKAQEDILNTITALHKSMAEEEIARGILTRETEGYLRHALTPEARKFIDAKGKTKAGFALEREYKGTISDINKRFREEHGVDFNLFVDDPFVALAVRGGEHAKAVRGYDLLEALRVHYGKEVGAKDPLPEGFVLTKIPELEGTAMPAEIAKIIDPVYKEASKLAQGYDKAMKIWKWGQTVIYPAYHILNVIGGIFNAAVLGGTRPEAFMTGTKLVKQFRTGVSSAETFTTPAGRTYTADELINLAGEHGVLGSPGFMDIARTSEQEIALMQKKGIAADIERFFRKIDPAKAARLEEDWMRMAVFFDRVVNKGEEPWIAARYTERFLFEYHPAGKTQWTKEVAQRAFPFWTFYWNNLLLQMRMMATQPGKYSAYGKTMDAMAEGQELQPWMAGLLLAPAEDQQVWTYQTPITSLQLFEKLTGFGRLAGTGQPTTLSQIIASMAPLAKIPIELATGRNVFTGREYKGTEFMGIPISPELETILTNVIGRPIHASRMAADIAGLDERKSGPYDVLTGPQRATPGDLTTTDKLIGWLGGARRYWTRSAIKEEQELKQQFFESRKRPDSFTWQQMYEVWKKEGMASPYSGIPEYLQPGHILGAAEGGPAELWNMIIQTAEENYEWMSAQVMRQRLPEQAWKQEMKWEQIELKYEGRVEERTEAMRERLAAKGKEINEAIIEKIEYDARKAKNIQLLNERLAKVRSFLNKLRTKLFRELDLLEKKKEKGFDDVHSQLQVQLIRRMIPEYERKYALIAGLIAEERAKEFDLPEQIIQAEDYSKVILGREEKVVRRGKGPALLYEDYIKRLVTDEEISRDWSIIQLEAVIVGFPSYVTPEASGRIQLPTEPEWIERQEKAKERITSLLGKGIYDFEAARKAETGEMPELLMPAKAYTDYWPAEAWIGIDKGITGAVPEHEEPSWLGAIAAKLWNWRGPGVQKPQKPEEPPAEMPAAYDADMDRDTEKEKRYWEIYEVLQEMMESDEFYYKVQDIATNTFNRGAGVEI